MRIRRGIAFLFFIWASIASAQTPYISELSLNSDNLWVEININGFDSESQTLSLQAGNLTFPFSIPSGFDSDFIILSSKNHTNGLILDDFSYEPGSTLRLLQNDSIIDSVRAGPFGVALSKGRLGSHSDSWYFFENESPGSSNNSETIQVELQKPSFTVAPGFYSDNVNLSIGSNQPGAIIRYTLDGSIPTEDSPIFSESILLTDRDGDPNDISMIPTNPFDENHPYSEHWQPPLGIVNKINVVRARTFFDGLEPSETVTGTWIIDEQEANRYTIPVISINTDRENLFDDEIGIYVHGESTNYNQRGRDWEREAHIEFFDDEGNMGFAQNIGVRIHGGTSRTRPRKTLRLYARSDYGQSWINYQIFPDKPISEFKRLLLRNSGNDWDGAIFRDAFMQVLIRGMGVDRQYTRAAVVFINGEYWGVHNMRDRLDNRYIETHYGLDEDEFTMMENNSVFDRGNPDGAAHFNQMRSYMANNPIQTQAVYDEVQTRMDVQNFMDYQIAQIYYRNTDWPGNNLAYWRSFNEYNPDAPEGLDGRWRWMVFDTDFGFGLDFDYVQGWDEGPAHNTLAFALQQNGPGWPNPDWSTFLLRRLMINTTFRNEFINRSADLLNSYFEPTRVVAVLDSMEAVYAPEMDEHIQRWVRPVSVGSWENEIQVMRDFALERASFMRQHIRERFGISGEFNLSVDVNDMEAGYIRVNRLDILPSTPGVEVQVYPWSGSYFNGIPVRLEAIPRTGYRFVSWAGDIESDEHIINITRNSDTVITAFFEPDEDEPDDPEITPWVLSNEPYVFTEWSSTSEAGTYPASMLFYQTDIVDPRLDDEFNALWTLPYDLSSRSRINGLGEDGFGFINTANPQEDGGGYLGSANLALNTEGVDQVTITWQGKTVRPNSRVYNIRLQYRVGNTDSFEDVLDDAGNPIEYERNETEGHRQIIGPVALPAVAVNQPYVELRWKYYFTGIRLDEDSGQRSKIAVTDIFITGSDISQATTMEFESFLSVGQTGYALPEFSVVAINDDGIPDANFNGVIELFIEDGPGELIGERSIQANSGRAQFDQVSFSEPGIYRIRAGSGSLQSVISGEIRVVELTEIVMPQFIQGAQPDNVDRVPFAFRIRIDGLKPSTTYRYYNRVIDDDDPYEQNGAGNAIFVNTSGGDFIRTTDSPRFRETDFGSRHYRFTTDSSGSYEGWFITEPSGNNRFTPGNELRMRILLNDGGTGEDIFHVIDTFSGVSVKRFGDLPGQLTGFYATSTAVPKNFVVFYDDESGETRPIGATFVEDSGFLADSRYAGFYGDFVNQNNGAFGAFLPNELPFGLRRIEERSLLDGFELSAAVSSNGVWENGIDTVNPRGGLNDIIYLELGTALPIQEDDELPGEFILKNNYPNPFNPTTQISYGIPESAFVRLDVYSINGQHITTLVNSVQSAGFHTVTFDSRSANLASGVYLYRLEAGEFVQVKKMVLVK